MFTEIVKAEGHLIDSQILSEIFDVVIACQSDYEVLEFQIGKNNDQISHIKLKIISDSKEILVRTLADLNMLGCYQLEKNEAILCAVTKDGCAPSDFYSTTNHKTAIWHHGQWLEVRDQRMDAVICIANDIAVCKKLRDLKRGDQIVCGGEGIRVVPEFKDRDRLEFTFMSNEISSERRVETAVKKIAELMCEQKTAGGKVVFVAGPVVVHTGGVEPMCQLIRSGYVNVLLAGNALAVHDIECALFGTSLGVDLEKGLSIYEGHKNHMKAINTINSAGGIAQAVKDRTLTSGIMYECVKTKVPYVLAGSIRDDGPLLDTNMDLIKAQDEYAQQLKGASLVICLSSMLHSIGAGNMLPSWVRTVCIDINPAVVSKLSDRGSMHAVGIVTDVGLFLNLLARYLN